MLKEGNFVGDRYEIVEQIGSGGMADVYKAKDHKLNRFIAVKVMKSEFRDDQSFISKFRAEAQAAAGLSHPNIVNVYDVGDENGVYYIVMELVEGITLKDYIIKKGKLSVREAISIAMQVSMGLEAAHNNNIVHRDIKPQNIIISTDGKVKVTDFGIARAASSNTISSNVMGSVHYSSPEQARGGYSDEKSDIYSLGITMYEMITGKVPFDGETTVAIAIKHLQEEMELPSKFVTDLPLSLEQIILKCTQKSADRRYATIEGLLRDLKLSLVNPNGDFVQLTSLSKHAKTVMISKEELEQIKSQKNVVKEYDDSPYSKKIADEFDDMDDEDNDEDDDEAINPRLTRIMMIGSIVTVGLILLIFLLLTAHALGIFKFPSSNNNNNNTTTTSGNNNETTETETRTGNEADNLIEVPDLFGKTFEAAQLELNQLGLGLSRSSESPQHSDTVAADLILSQSYEKGSKVDRNTRISVVISAGEEPITIPNLYDYEEAQAKAEIESLGLPVETIEEYSDTITKGRVIRTDPSSAIGVKKGRTVTIVVSKGKEIIRVPSTKGYTETAAIAELQRLGLTIKNPVTLGYSTQEAGTVYDQFPAAYTEVERGTEITLYITQPKVYRLSTYVAEPSGYEGGPIVMQYVQGGQVSLIFDWTEGILFPQLVESDNLPDNTPGIIYMTERRYTNDTRTEFEDITHTVTISKADYIEIVE